MPSREEALAVVLGFASAEQMGRVPRSPHTLPDFARIPAEARAIRSHAAAAIRSARRRRVSLDQAAFEVGVPLEAIMWWFPDAVAAELGGEVYATAEDATTRLRPIVVEGEVTFVAVEGSAEAERVARMFAVQWDFISDRATAEELAALPDTTVAGRRLERDPRVLEELAQAGEFDLDEIYRELFE